MGLNIFTPWFSSPPECKGDEVSVFKEVIPGTTTVSLETKEGVAELRDSCELSDEHMAIKAAVQRLMRNLTFKAKFGEEIEEFLREYLAAPATLEDYGGENVTFSDIAAAMSTDLKVDKKYDINIAVEFHIVSIFYRLQKDLPFDCYFHECADEDKGVSDAIIRLSMTTGFGFSVDEMNTAYQNKTYLVSGEEVHLPSREDLSGSVEEISSEISRRYNLPPRAYSLEDNSDYHVLALFVMMNGFKYNKCESFMMREVYGEKGVVEGFIPVPAPCVATAAKNYDTVSASNVYAGK